MLKQNEPHKSDKQVWFNNIILTNIWILLNFVDDQKLIMYLSPEAVILVIKSCSKYFLTKSVLETYL